MKTNVRAFPVLLLSVLVAALASCTSGTKLREAELTNIEHWLPGTYDNALQVDQDVSGGATSHDPVDVVIVRISSMMIGKIVFYEQQFDSRDTRRVLHQRLHRFEASEDGKEILHSVLLLREPSRWTSGYRRPEIFKSLMPDDVTPGTCPLKWKFEAGAFVGTNSGACRANTSTGRPASLQTRMELTETELTISERLVDSSGADIVGSRDAVIKFVKKGG